MYDRSKAKQNKVQEIRAHICLIYYMRYKPVDTYDKTYVFINITLPSYFILFYSSYTWVYRKSDMSYSVNVGSNTDYKIQINV